MNKYLQLAFFTLILTASNQSLTAQPDTWTEVAPGYGKLLLEFLINWISSILPE